MPGCMGETDFPSFGKSPPSFSIKEWYEKLGYVSWTEEPLYEDIALDGQVVKLWEAFMRRWCNRDLR